MSLAPEEHSHPLLLHLQDARQGHAQARHQSELEPKRVWVSTFSRSTQHDEIASYSDSTPLPGHIRAR